MPDPPLQPVKPLREYLLHPLHNLRKLKPIRRLNVEGKPVILKPQQTNLEDIALFRLPEDPVEEGKCDGPSEQGLPIVDAGTYFVPDILTK
jgi:hypothetical protein